MAINRATGKLYSYSPTGTTTTEEFLFASIEDFIDCLIEDDREHVDDFLLFEVGKIYKPDVEYKEILDGEIY
jgi:hypothetical protein